MREVDLILGRFADECLAGLSDGELEPYERLLEVPSPALLSWVTGEAKPPADHDTPLLRRVLEYHRKPKAKL